MGRNESYTAPLRQQIDAARELCRRGRVAVARGLVDDLLAGNEQVPSLWSLASDIARLEGRIAAAVSAAERASSLAPHDLNLLINKGRCLALAGDVTAATDVVEEALRAGCASADNLNALAAVLFRCEQQTRALELYERAAAADPGNVDAQRGLALAHRAAGQITQAESATNKVLAARPDDYEIVHLRSSLRKQSRRENHLTDLERMFARSFSSWRGYVHVGYALAKELEDLEEYDRSFETLKSAATVKRRHMNYDVRGDLEIIQRIREVFDRPKIEALGGNGCASDQPIFIVGLPRTGSTLIERILTSHPEVESCGELNTFALELVKATTAGSRGRDLPRALLPQASSGVDMEALGRSYLESIRPLRRGANYFIDKMPMNSLYAGLIHLALPHAKIILVERGAMDTCYAMYKFLFKEAYPFSYDLTEMAQYYLEHRGMMRHWAMVLPEKTLCRVQYERLVVDPEGETRRLLGHLGLDMHEDCLRFERNSRTSMTGSATQVRQPIYRSSVNLWRKYEKYLEPVVAVLQAAGMNVDQT